jgi:hypothetical protein
MLKSNLSSMVAVFMGGKILLFFLFLNFFLKCF